MDVLKDEILKKFGEHIKELRLKSGLTQDDVVLNGSKITKGTISDIENGKRNFSFTTLIDLAKGLNLPPKELFDFELDIKKYKIDE
ncbi:helix-turn-helix domain-containing protein [Chryseobacterium flavum]|uniref:helix-turn-helix domain-containing protein n=1 Tax=Chryseobacterium flavum TaxID=415851 RepID=UPI0028B19222|nr:helix-turn-helix transcriptional regulator [Chryseobacterium flavum]